MLSRRYVINVDVEQAAERMRQFFAFVDLAEVLEATAVVEQGDDFSPQAFVVADGCFPARFIEHHCREVAPCLLEDAHIPIGSFGQGIRAIILVAEGQIGRHLQEIILARVEIHPVAESILAITGQP